MIAFYNETCPYFFAGEWGHIPVCILFVQVRSQREAHVCVCVWVGAGVGGVGLFICFTIVHHGPIIRAPELVHFWLHDILFQRHTWVLKRVKDPPARDI